jgi:hypothetical protein
MGGVCYHRTPGQSDLQHLRGELYDGTADQLIAGATVGTVFYGAVRSPGGSVSGLVVLQDRSGVHGFNYYRKLIEETSGPFQYGCPQRILEMLTPLPDCQHTDSYCVHCNRQIYPDGERWVSRARPGQRAHVAGPRCNSGYPTTAAVNGKSPCHAPGGAGPCPTCTAREWRQQCLQEIERSGQHPPLKTHDTFTLAAPLTFNDGVKESTFTLTDARRRRYRRASDGRIVRLPARERWPNYVILNAATG